MTLLFLLSALVGLAVTAPQILPLSKFGPGESVIVNGVEVGSKLYVASKDERSYLRNISVRTGPKWTSFATLADYYSDGTPKYLNITGDVEIKTLNDFGTTERLRGYIYITTYQQAFDPSFAVYVITGKQTISRDGMRTISVILNTHLDADFTDVDVPEKTSYVTNIQHSHNTNLYLMWGVPADNWNEVANNTFFVNPIMLNSTKVFFDHIEPLQVGLDYWYFVSTGPVTMDIENTYVNAHNYTTTSVNTTGIILNNFLFESHCINFLLDKTRARTTGTLISTYLTSDVTFQLVGDAESVTNTYGINSNVNQNLSVYNFQANSLIVDSNILPGDFYCQYFGFSSDLFPVTNDPTISSIGTTSRPIVTTAKVVATTKSSSSRIVLDLLILLLSSFFLL